MSDNREYAIQLAQSLGATVDICKRFGFLSIAVLAPTGYHWRDGHHVFHVMQGEDETEQSVWGDVMSEMQAGLLRCESHFPVCKAFHGEYLKRVISERG